MQSRETTVYDDSRQFCTDVRGGRFEVAWTVPVPFRKARNGTASTKLQRRLDLDFVAAARLVGGHPCAGSRIDVQSRSYDS